MKKPILKHFLLCLFSFVLLKAVCVQAQLVALWHFDENSGKVVKDSSPNGNDGKLIGGEWVDGKIGKALLFNGTAQNGVVVEHKPSQVLKNQITVETWANVITFVSSANIVRKGIYKAAGGTTGWAIDNAGANSGIRHVAYLKSGLLVIDDGTKLEQKKWQHISFTYDGKELKAYLDGKMYKTINSPVGDLADNVEDIGIGIRADATSPFNGIIDEVAIWSIVRTEDEIKQDMTGIKVAAVSVGDKLTTTWGTIKSRLF